MNLGQAVLLTLQVVFFITYKGQNSTSNENMTALYHILIIQ